MTILDKCKQIIDTESGRVLLYRDEVEAVLTAGDTISRQEAISRAVEISLFGKLVKVVAVSELKALPSAQPERKWIPCSNPPKHHKDVIVRGIEAIGNVTVHKVMQWDVDTWRPTDYAPSVTWKEWSEI